MKWGERKIDIKKITSERIDESRELSSGEETLEELQQWKSSSIFWGVAAMAIFSFGGVRV